MITEFSHLGWGRLDISPVSQQSEVSPRDLPQLGHLLWKEALVVPSVVLEFVWPRAPLGALSCPPPCTEAHRFSCSCFVTVVVLMGWFTVGSDYCRHCDTRATV